MVDGSEPPLVMPFAPCLECLGIKDQAQPLLQTLPMRLYADQPGQAALRIRIGKFLARLENLRGGIVHFGRNTCRSTPSPFDE